MNAALQMACMTCHKKNDRTKSDRLHYILFHTPRNATQREADPDARALESAILMEANTHCPYGMPCQNLRSEEQEGHSRDIGSKGRRDGKERGNGDVPRAFPAGVPDFRKDLIYEDRPHIHT